MIKRPPRAAEDRGFFHYLGGDRQQPMAELLTVPLDRGMGYPRAMFEFRPADEDCPRDCPICWPRGGRS